MLIHEYPSLPVQFANILHPYLHLSQQQNPIPTRAKVPGHSTNPQFLYAGERIKNAKTIGQAVLNMKAATTLANPTLRFPKGPLQRSTRSTIDQIIAIAQNEPSHMIPRILSLRASLAPMTSLDASGQTRVVRSCPIVKVIESLKVGRLGSCPVETGEQRLEGFKWGYKKLKCVRLADNF